MSLTINDREFQKALDSYAATSRKELPGVLNKVAKDVGLTAAKHAPRAVKNEIKKLETAWKSGDLSWVKYVSKWMSASGKSGAQGSRYFKTKSFRKLMKSYDSQSMSFSGTRGLYQLEAKRLSRRLINSRVRAIGFIAHSFAMAGRLVDPNSTAALPRGKGKSKAKGWATPANVGQGERLRSVLNMAWEVEHRKGASEIGQRVLARALQSKSTDMKIRIMQRLQQIADQHQGTKRR